MTLERCENRQPRAVVSNPAYGWVQVPQTGVYWHNGGTGGYSSFAFFDPKNRVAAIVLTNLSVDESGSFADRIGQHIGQPFSGNAAIEIE